VVLIIRLISIALVVKAAIQNIRMIMGCIINMMIIVIISLLMIMVR